MRNIADILTFELNRIAQEGGLQPDGKWRLGVILIAIASIPLAVILLWVTVLKQPRTAPIQADKYLALHPEASNRTHHLTQANLEKIPILFVGRPSKNNGLGIEAKSFFAFDIPCAFRATLTGIPKLVKAANALASFGIPLHSKTIAAVIFRSLLGLTHATWWRHASLKPKTVIFGHTGNVDCSLLEQEMQNSGTQTIHVVHGVGHGWAFAGLSDLAIYTNGHDANSAPDITYKRAKHITLAMPDPIQSNGPCLVLTSYTHPMNSEYESGGTNADETVLRWVQKSKILPAKHWHPHPALYLVSKQHQNQVTNTASDCGIERPTTPFDLPSASLILTTPSTVALDALRAGKLPILLVAAPLPDGTIYSYFDQARSSEQLQTLLESYEDPAYVSQRYAEVWQAVQPSGPLTRIAIDSALSELGVQ